MTLIRIEGLVKEYRIGTAEPLRALDGVDLTIEEGEYVSIVGPSGSGKSTLLQILGLLDRPTSGSYSFLGKDVGRLDDNALTDLRAREIGFIFQMFNLLPRMNVEENILLPAVYRGIPVEGERLEEILEKLGLASHRRHTPAQLSGGQQQRVAIGRALVNRPRMILADEPSGNLPQKQAHEIMQELERLNREGITLVVVTHDPGIAARASRRIQVVDGAIVADERGSVSSPAREPTPRSETKHSGGWNGKLLAETFRIALQSLERNKVRTFLTMLGIIIGVFSVISMLAIGEGAKKDMEETLRQMGSNMFRVSSYRPSPKGLGVQRAKVYRLSWSDYEAIVALDARTDTIRNVAPVVTGPASVNYGGKTWGTVVNGVEAVYERMRNSTPAVGRFFSPAEIDGRETVCILGPTVHQNLFRPDENPLGQTVKINQKSFRVVGLLPAKGSIWGADEDDVVLVPIRTAMGKLFGQKHLSYLFVQASDELNLERAIDLVSGELRRQHDLDERDESDFKIKNFAEIRRTIEEVTGTMTRFIGIIAAISLLVGGIGIMNIMLVSVTERTREIGVRKAIGARRRDILFQFLAESTMIAVVGGVIGIFLSFAGGFVMTHALDWEIGLKVSFVALSFMFAFLVGVFFGIYPAHKASKLLPIHALRYE